MIYTPQTKKALKLCFEAHRNQLDKSGVPYVFHPFHLAEQMKDEVTTVVALLHDVVEDTDYTLQDIADMGFSKEVTDALALLTHDETVPYMEYVALVKKNPVATAVKLADLKHNSDLSRLEAVDEGAIARQMKYEKAIAFLEDKKVARASMTLERFRIYHSLLIEHYQYIESHLEGIYACISGKGFFESLRDVSRDSIGRLVAEIKDIDKYRKILSEEKYEELAGLCQRRNFWCHDCYYDMCFVSGGVKKQEDALKLVKDLQTAEELRAFLFERQRELMENLY